VARGSRVLDVGCGDGALLAYLGREKDVDGRGIELSMSGVRTAVSHGLSVIQGDADTDLKDYPTGSFDYVILSQTLQATRAPKGVIEQLLRIGRHAIVSFPNFAHWRLRLHLLVDGRMPVTGAMPYEWWETPNIHFCTIRDFVVLCQELGISIERSLCLDVNGKVQPFPATGGLANLLGGQAVYLLSLTEPHRGRRPWPDVAPAPSGG
ncbi:MAG: methionine biosynthesis protein MetW, partial [Alphaproteobacteria bacterium]|nr:methionine biosynthesis protein MetW [Alphaproteobacteria bacterium]